MDEPVWLTADIVVEVHRRQLRLFGGPEGVRDPGALDSALGRPRNRWAYEEAGLIDLAASYAFGIARNHPFVDGNKRAAFLSMVAFLDVNGVAFAAAEEKVVITIRALAAGEIGEAEVAAWIAGSLAPPG